jgi:hypothetical protein
MKAFASAAVALSLVLGGISLVAQQAPQPTPAQLEANKKVAMEFYRPGITPEERIALIHRDYQQHNATYDPSRISRSYRGPFYPVFSRLWGR